MNLIDKYLGEEEVNEKLKWESMLGGQKAMRQFPNQYDAKMEVEKILRKK